ncbi:hypothetical protein SAMN04487785_105358 [Dyella jiangningensis]|uniref:hypothetical protein n=1 Tax=Dyella sp. AtDHG13 TaxID=1938897 RepID=UPI000892450B|nr:hypothetical protein [Dyella sp. AtDHG13]PXV52287.1 hypothetical protein BDW41_1207 [Dyella sp. AtDHG13]SDK16533.1 hypothetical protein SAMN04487785_105358 [Dyella jiangningensis]
MRLSRLLFPGLAFLASLFAPGVLRANPGLHTCFWQGPYSVADLPVYNQPPYPDTHAAYWTAQFVIPAGASVVLNGTYPVARYMSLISYHTANATPVSDLPDIGIQPDAGSINPFVAGAPRYGSSPTNYTVQLAAGNAPSSPAANTLYSGTTDQTMTVMYRVYVPDNGLDEAGGVALPAMSIHNADGSITTGSAACSAAQASQSLIPTTIIGQLAYLPVRLADPPLPVVVWLQTRLILMAALVDGFANPDNAYLEASLSRNYGTVAVVTGLRPTTPQTLPNAAVMGTGNMRYWSLCTYEFYTEATTDCAFDQGLITDSTGNYTIAISQTADRPSNAVPNCGFNWLHWSEAGDGDGHTNDGFLILRNMLPDPSFTHAIQNVPLPVAAATSALVMGPYLPTVTYMSKADFEAKGCSPM